MSKDSDQHSISVVQAAAKVALYSSSAKQRLANQLLLRARDTNHSAYTAQISLENAAQAAWLSPKELLDQLRDDPCFEVVKGPATAGGSAHIFVALDVPHIISAARSSTRTGYLVEELPPPKGYVLGVHPLRPGQPNCKQFVTFGECAYNERCVFNHPGKQTHDEHKQPITASSSSKQPQPHNSTPAAHKEPAPPPSKPAWGGAGVPRTALQHVQERPHDSANPSTAVTSSQQQQMQQQQHAQDGATPSTAQIVTTSTQQQQQHGHEPAGGTPASNGNEGLPSASGQASGSSTAQQADTTSVEVNHGEQANQQQREHARQPPEQQQQQSQQQAAPRYPPGFAPPTYQGRPCPLMMLRGMCPMGAKCPFDHNTKAGGQAANTTAAQHQGVTHISTTAAAQGPSLTATVPEQSVVSPLAADAQPLTPESSGSLSAAAGPTSAAGAAAGPTAVATAPQTAAGGSASQPVGAPAAAATRQPPSSWKALLAGPGTQQQQQEQQQAQPGRSGAAAAAAAAGSDDAGESEAGVNRSVPQQHADKLLGWTEGNLPQLRGAANCPFYMGTGACKFRERCVYHHPPAAMHPACVLNGEMPKRYNINNRPRYARLVNHLYRLWDYDSCVESQLKIWLARHLLDRNNQRTHMFSSAAAKPAIYNHGRGSYGQPLGPYTCAMGQAGELLHHMWRAQPDEAASAPMPYTRALRELLAGDPYLEVVVDPHCASHYWVKLDVDKVKQMLNF